MLSTYTYSRGALGTRASRVKMQEVWLRATADLAAAIPLLLSLHRRDVHRAGAGAAIQERHCCHAVLGAMRARLVTRLNDSCLSVVCFSFLSFLILFRTGQSA